MEILKVDQIDCDLCEETFLKGEALCSHLNGIFKWSEGPPPLLDPLKLYVQKNLEGFEERQAIRNARHEARRAWYKTYKLKKNKK